MDKIIIPPSYNYIGVFLTLRCNLNCPYCINRQGEFEVTGELTGKQWVEGLSRIDTTEDFPITLQGGEPTIHRDFYDIVGNLHGKKLDLLTNGKFNLTKFMGYVHNGVFRRKREPYASIRLSHHAGLNDGYLMDKVGQLKSNGYSVGVFGLDDSTDKSEMVKFCKDANVLYAVKAYLDKDPAKNTGVYRYPAAVRGKRKKVKCRPSELLIAPDGRMYRCHSDLYAGINAYGNILDEEVKIPDGFLPCDRFGLCNPCDVKIKTNRLLAEGHTSVEIKGC